MSGFVGFSKDVLLIDFESTGFEYNEAGEVVEIGEPTQLGAVLLDKQSLVEKDKFLSDIQADPNKLNPWVLEHTDITKERVVKAPAAKLVAQKFFDQFGTDVYLASWNQRDDRAWLHDFIQSIGKRESTYDYHHLDIWPIAYTYLCQLGHPEVIRSEDTFLAFGQGARGAHNALDDCRRTAEILRAVVNQTELSL